MDLAPFEETYDLLQHEGIVRWFSKLAGGYGLNLGGIAKSGDQLSRRRFVAQRGGDCYVQLNPAVGFKGMRAKAEHISHYRGFLFDLDPDLGSEPRMEERAAAMAAGISQLSTELGISISPWIIDSGRGMQAWVLGDLFLPSDRVQWRAMLRRSVGAMVRRVHLPAGWHVDPKVCDVSRIVRLPGTTNSKTGREASFVSRGTMVPDLYDRLLEVDPGEDPPEEQPTLPDTYDSYGQVWLRLTGAAQLFITVGKRYPGRHSDLWHTAEILHREGLTRGAAKRACWMGARYSRPKLTMADVEYALGRAGYPPEK